MDKDPTWEWLTERMISPYPEVAAAAKLLRTEMAIEMFAKLDACEWTAAMALEMYKDVK